MFAVTISCECLWQLRLISLLTRKSSSSHIAARSLAELTCSKNVSRTTFRHLILIWLWTFRATRFLLPTFLFFFSRWIPFEVNNEQFFKLNYTKCSSRKPRLSKNKIYIRHNMAPELPWKSLGCDGKHLNNKSSRLWSAAALQRMSYQFVAWSQIF